MTKNKTKSLAVAVNMFNVLYFKFYDAKATIHMVVKYYEFGEQQKWHRMDFSNCMDYLIIGRLKQWLIIQTTALLERNPYNRSIIFGSVINEMNCNHEELENELAKIKNNFSEFLENIRLIRNKEYAHNDNTYRGNLEKVSYDLDNVPNESFEMLYLSLEKLLLKMKNHFSNCEGLDIKDYEYEKGIDIWFNQRLHYIEGKEQLS